MDDAFADVVFCCCLNFHDLSNMVSYNVQIPWWFQIFDFEILDDTVYFCGNELQSNRACFVFQAPLSQNNRSFAIPNPNRETYYDVAYNLSTGSISVVPWYGYNKILTAINPYNIVLEMYPPERRWFSIDFVPNTPYYTVRGSAATSAAKSKIWRYQENRINCVTVNPVAIVDIPEYENVRSIIQFIRQPSLSIHSLDVKASRNSLNYYCR